MKKYLLALVAVVAVLAQSLLNRLRGWGGINLPSQIKRAMCQFVPCVTLWWCGCTWYYIAAAFVAAMFGLAVGHGRYFALNRARPTDRGDNWPGKLVALFVKKRDSWLFDALALAITGLAFTLPYAIVSAQISIVAALCIAAAGILKVAAYELAIRIVGVGDKGDAHLRLAEFLAGAVFGAGFAVPVALVFLKG